MLKRIVFIVFCALFYLIVSAIFAEFSRAGDCDTAISSDTTTKLVCADNDTLTVSGSITRTNEDAPDDVAVDAEGEDGVTITITDTGTIQTITDTGTIVADDAIQGTSSLNLTVDNSGTIFAGRDWAIQLKEADKITVTNRATGTIKTTKGLSGSQAAVGGTKMGNSGNCVTEECFGLTLHNYGTIEANEEAVYGGGAASQTSKKTKIYNYDGGTINADKRPVYILSGEDIELYNYDGATIEADDGNYGVNFKNSSTITIDNAGTISTSASYTVGLQNAVTVNLDNSGTIAAGGNFGVYCFACEDLTLTNSGTISADLLIGVSARLVTGTNTITNSGTISAEGTMGVDLRNATGVTLVNSGTISATGNAILADNAFSPTITNSGTVTALAGVSTKGAITLSQNDAENLGTDATITNSGTISALGTNAVGIIIGDGTGVYNDVTITNSGTISGVDDSIGIVGSGTTGTNIITKGEATYTGEIEMDSAAATMTLDCSITKDMDIEIHGKTNMTVTNNLCGNDTYEILDSSLAADADNSETNGYLRIYGEDLEIAQNNPKYRSENVLTKLRGLFNAANYIHWQAPEEKFFKIFHSTQKREGIYSGDMSGVVGQLNPFVWGSLRSNVFLGYTRQGGDFDNGEFLGGDNFALGLKNVYENNAFTASFTPMIGMADLKITDFDTDTKTSITTNLLSEFAGINGKLGREIKLSEEGSLDLNIQSTLGIQRFPEYLAIFADGDLTVDEAVEQILGVGFEVKYKDELKKGFIIQPYVGYNINNNFNNKIKITADGENKNVSPAYTTTSGYYAGVSFTKEKDGLDFDLDLMYGNEDGLINQIAAVSLTKSFGKAKKETIKLEPVPDFPKVDESLTTQDYTKDLNKLETQNEKLKLLAEKVLQESEISKHLIKELVTEVEKLKFTNQIFKDKILKLENENVELPQTIEKGDQKPKVDKFKLLLFLATIYGLAGGLTLLIISFMNIIRLKLVNQI